VAAADLGANGVAFTVSMISPANAWIRRRASAGRCRASGGKSTRRVELPDAPCLHFTSLAKICSCGFVWTSASFERSRFLLVWTALVFWASGRTMIPPSNTARARPSSTTL
jgi:hypothetical protein